MSDSEKLKRTPLFDQHVALGAKMVPFAGFEMPVRYPAGIIEEHTAVREAVGLFDVSHMGELFVTGPDTIPFLEKMTCNYVGRIADGQAQYTALPNPEGGVIDDIIIYRYNPERFLLCVNASNADIDFSWLKEHESGDVTVKNASDQYGQIAVQGPKAFMLLEEILGEDFSASLKPFWFKDVTYQGQTAIVARTGYTGEDGVEVFVPNAQTPALWEELLSAGKSLGVQPCGLASRDTLRLEVCYPLHGHELGTQYSAIESGLSWIVKPKKKGEFIGRKVLEAQLTDGAPRSLVGFQVVDNFIVREGAEVLDEAGKVIGAVTSGTRTPTVSKNNGNRSIGLAIIDAENNVVGRELQAVVRGKAHAIKIVETPFYKKG